MPDETLAPGPLTPVEPSTSDVDAEAQPVAPQEAEAEDAAFPQADPAPDGVPQAPARARADPARLEPIKPVDECAWPYPARGARLHFDGPA